MKRFQFCYCVGHSTERKIPEKLIRHSFSNHIWRVLFSIFRYYIGLQTIKIFRSKKKNSNSNYLKIFQKLVASRTWYDSTVLPFTDGWQGNNYYIVKQVLKPKTPEVCDRRRVWQPQVFRALLYLLCFFYFFHFKASIYNRKLF